MRESLITVRQKILAALLPACAATGTKELAKQLVQVLEEIDEEHRQDIAALEMLVLNSRDALSNTVDQVRTALAGGQVGKWANLYNMRSLPDELDT